MSPQYRTALKYFPRLLNARGLFVSSINISRAMTNDIKPRRAILYVPGHDRRKIEKLSSLNVDCAVLDCEDGVAANKKEEARKVICDVAENFNFGKTEYAVRINSIDSGLATEDLRAFLDAKRLPQLFMVPKVDSKDHILWLDNEINNRQRQETIKYIIFVESAKSLLDLRDICEAAVCLSNQNGGMSRLEGVVFGSDDFCASIGATRTDGASELMLARQMVVLVAKAFGLQAIDMVHINYKDLEGLSKCAKEGYYMGFTGKQVIHPTQVPIVQEAFSPSKEKVEWARDLVRLFNEHQKAGKGAFTYHGAMIDRPLLLQAEYIIKIAEKFE